MATTQQPLNPYIAGKVVGGERGFFGRQDVLRGVERTLASLDQNALVLFGQRRIGKTSILLQLERHLPSPPFVPVYFDLMYKARLPLNRVLYELAATAAPLVGVPPPAEAEFIGGDDAFRHAFLPAAYEALGEERRLVFLFDEFDVLDVAAEKNLPDTAAARAFFPYLRGLMAEEPRLGFVFVVGRKTDEMSTDFLATFKAARYRRVSVLKLEAAQELITLAQREGSLNFTDEAIERILALTAGHPFFIQALCHILFNCAYEAGLQEIPTVGVTDVDSVIPDVLEEWNQAFEWVWDGLPPAERIIFSAIAIHTDEATVLTRDEIMAILQDTGIRILIKELAWAPRTLVEWEMLKEADGGYHFFVELMRRWVAEQKRLEWVKDELDRVIPLADTLYRSGAGYYSAGEVESAIGQLQQALRKNPNHLKARLLLGTIYREQGQLEEALAEFEAAYRYGKVEEGRYELVRTLLAYGEVLERESDEGEALKAYDRALEVSPREQVAQERRAAIWEHRGDAALEAGEFETAITAYEQAEAKEKLEQARTKKRKLEFEQLAQEGAVHEEREEWAQAAEIYRQLMGLDSEDQRWQEGFQRAEEELWLVERYAEGAGYVHEEQWAEAQHALADVVYKRPGYKDAATLLTVATQRARGKVDMVSQLEEQGKQLEKQAEQMKKQVDKNNELAEAVVRLKEQAEQLERQAKQRARLLFIGLGMAAVLLAVSVWGALRYQSSQDTRQMDATATALATAAEAMAQTRVAVALQGTQLAEPHATEAAEPRATATLTLAPTPTPLPSVTPTPTDTATPTEPSAPPSCSGGILACLGGARGCCGKRGLCAGWGHPGLGVG